jgi:hypothetical protein
MGKMTVGRRSHKWTIAEVRLFEPLDELAAAAPLSPEDSLNHLPSGHHLQETREDDLIRSTRYLREHWGPTRS